MTMTERAPDGRKRKIKVSSMTERVERAKQHRTKWEQEWMMCRDIYRGNAAFMAYTLISPNSRVRASDRGFGTHVEVNEAKAIVDTLFAASTTRVPKINVIPRRAENEEKARLVSSVVNYWWRTRGAHSSFQRAQKDAITLGHGWLKVVWDFEEEQAPWSEEDKDLRRQTFAAQVQVAAVQNPESAPVLPDHDQINAMVEEEAKNNPKTVFKHEYPQARYVDPWDMFIDPDAYHFDDARWVCQRFYAPYAEIRYDDRYNAKAREMLASSASPTPQANLFNLNRDGRRTDSRLTTPPSSPMEEMVTLYEFHDIVEGTWCIFAEGAKEFLAPPQVSPYKGSPYRQPFEMLRNHETGELYPQGDVIQVIPLIWEQNETRTQAMIHRKQLNTKFLAARDTLDEQTVAQLASTEPGQVVAVPKHPAARLEDTVRPLQQPAVPADYAAMAAIQQDDIARVSGLSDLARGTAQVSRRSAHEAQILHQASAGRTADKMSKAQESAGRIGGRMVLLAQLLLTGDDVIRIVGEDGAQRWETFNREALQGMYEFEVEHGSMTPRDEQSQQHEAQLLMNQLAPFVQMGYVNPHKLIEELLRAYGVDNPESYLAQPDQQAMLEAQVTAAGGVPQQPLPGGLPSGMPNS